MFKFLKSDPSKKLEREFKALQTKAMQAQRNGNIRGYSELTAQAEAIYLKIEQLRTDADK